MNTYMQDIEDALQLVDVTWLPVVRRALDSMQQAWPAYLPELMRSDYLPNGQRLFAAFSQPLPAVRYILIGEGPYPRAESATGYCFMDGAVGSLWSDEADGGLSKKVNRATSLRNFMKMLMQAANPGQQLEAAGVVAVARRARAQGSRITQTLPDLQDELHARGFLLLNASLVFRTEVAPVKEAKPWQTFLAQVLQGMIDLAQQEGRALPSLVLWGKIAAQLEQLPQLAAFPQIKAEHPYNLSFIQNMAMQQLFAPMDLLHLTD